MTVPAFTDVGDVVHRFEAHDHLLDEGTAAAIFLATTLGRPLLLEGEPGSVKPQRPKHWPRCSIRRWSGCSVTRV